MTTRDPLDRAASIQGSGLDYSDLDSLEVTDEPEPFGIEDEEIPGLRLRETEDAEVEKFFSAFAGYMPDEHGWPVATFEKFPTWIHNGDPYWTDGRCQTAKNDDHCRLIYEEQAPDNQFYSEASPLSGHYRERARRFHNFIAQRQTGGHEVKGLTLQDMFDAKRDWWLKWIEQVTSPSRSRWERVKSLRNGWKQFWRQYYSHDIPTITFLPRSHVNEIVDVFAEHGIRSKSSQ
jgi:hypothetical protein